MNPVAANFSIVWMSPESMDSTVIAANCSNWDPGLINDAASAVAGAAAADDLQIRERGLRTAAAAAAVEGLLRHALVLLVQRRCRAPAEKAICKQNSMNAHSTPCTHLITPAGAYV
jgi:hypothetical protein